MDVISLIFIILAGVLWGTAPLFTTFLSELGFNPAQMTSARYAIGAVILLIFVLLKNPKGLIRIKPFELLLFFISGLGLYGTSVFYYMAMQTASRSVAAILLYTTPVFVMIFSVLYFKEKITVKKIISLFAIMLGCCFITGVFGGIQFDKMGIFFGFMSSFAYTVYSIVAKFEAKHKSDPVVATTYAFIVAGILSFFFANPVDTIHTATQNPLPSTLLLIGLAIFTGILPYTFFTIAMKKIPAGVTSAMATLEPLTATVISVAIFGEPITVFMAIGIALILGSVMLLSFGNNATK